MTRGCSVADCERVHYGRGWCKYHYRRWFDHGDPLWVRPTAEERRATPEVLRHRILSHVKISDTGCWEWTAYIDRGGYGKTNVAGHTRLAHRVAYEMWVAPIPEGLEIDHLCRVRRCVNPAHLEPVDRRTNVLRGFSPSAIAARRSHCKNGHEFTPENTYTYRSTAGWHRRECRICRAAYMAEWERARRSA